VELQVGEEDIEAGRNGAVRAALVALELEDLAEAVFGDGEGQKRASRQRVI